LDFGYFVTNPMLFFRIDESIHLETPRPEMAEIVTASVQKNLEHLKPWMPWAVDDYSTEHARTWIDTSQNAIDGSFNLIIFEGQQMLGTIGIHELSTIHRHTSMGYWIDKDLVGKGIITRCCRVLLDHLFGTMELNRVQINTNVENVRSRAIPERLGFTQEGVLRKIELVEGEFRDWAVYGLLKGEWQAKKL
jgi:ribosomal-protein-serine acetyltransferase